MSFNPNTYINQGEPESSFAMAIENDDNSIVHVKKAYILNIISNPQETSNWRNFCIQWERYAIHNFTVPPGPLLQNNNSYATLHQYTSQNDVDFGEVGSQTYEAIYGDLLEYDIPYPSHYIEQPGNDGYEYDEYSFSSRQYYKLPYEFSLQPGEMFKFSLVFRPQFRVIDFYRAKIVVEYITATGEFFVKEQMIHADYHTTIKQIDGKQFHENILTVNGIQKGNILLAQ
jgi:hypothetical protein